MERVRSALVTHNPVQPNATSININKRGVKANLCITSIIMNYSIDFLFVVLFSGLGIGIGKSYQIANSPRFKPLKLLKMWKIHLKIINANGLD